MGCLGVGEAARGEQLTANQGQECKIARSECLYAALFATFFDVQGTPAIFGLLSNGQEGVYISSLIFAFHTEYSLASAEAET